MYGMEHTLVTSAGLLGAGMVLLPGMRRLVWRMTFGRYLTPQAATEAAEARLSLMRKELETQQGDIKKLTERLSMAKEEYARGLSKLKGAAKEMRRLETHVQSSESRANGTCIAFGSHVHLVICSDRWCGVAFRVVV